MRACRAGPPGGRLTPGRAPLGADCRLGSRALLSGTPKPPPGRLPKPLQLRHGLDSEFSTPGPHGPWTLRPPKLAPRSPPTCHAEVGGQAHEGSSGQGCPPPRLRVSSCTLGRPLLGLRLCHCREPGTAHQRMGRKGPPAAGLLLSPRAPRGNSRVTGAFSSTLSPSSSCSGSFLNSERSDRSSWETASWARQAASDGGALLGVGAWSEGPIPRRSRDPGVCPTLQGQPWPPSPQGGPPGRSGGHSHTARGQDEQVDLGPLGSRMAVQVTPFMGWCLAGAAGRGAHGCVG